MTKPQMVILVGPPGSGKSTLAKKYESQGFIRISQDDMGKQGHQDAFRDACREGKNIIVDRMGFNVQQRSNYLAHAKIHNYETEIIVIHESAETCMKRMLYRIEQEGHPTIKDKIGAHAALKTFFTRYERPTSEESIKITFIYPEGDKPECVVIDLDGTLCNVEHRRHFVRRIDGQRKDWAAFFNGISEDTPNEWCVQLVGRFAPRCKIVFCSGRDDNHRKVSKEWIDRHCHFYGQENPYDLYMRHRNDSRQDYLVKEILLDFEILTRYKPWFIVDDRQQVVDMWRRRGFTCLQCDTGDF